MPADGGVFPGMAVPPLQPNATPPTYPPPPNQPPLTPPGWDSHEVALDMTLGAAAMIAALLTQQYLKSSSVLGSLLTGVSSVMILGACLNVLALLLTRPLHLFNGDELPIAMSSNRGAHDLIYFGLLPPIIFEAGFHMRKHRFFAEFGTILGYAIVGTLIAIIVTGTLVWALAQHHRVLWTDFTLTQSMVFASLISSTDPVATLAILKSVQANGLLSDLIFGESALNDALAIVAFDIFLRQAKAQQSDGEVFASVADLLDPLGEVLACLVGSLLLGVLIGLISAVLSKRMRAMPRHARPRPPLELMLIVLFSGFSFGSADRAGLSGVMSLFFCAIVMRHYTFYNISLRAQRASRILFTTVSELAETCLSLLLGIAFVDYIIVAVDGTATWPHTWDLPFLLLSFPIVFLARAIMVGLVSTIANCFRGNKRKITPKMQFVILFAGMRGSVSFALAIILPAASLHTGSTVADREAEWTVPIVSTTLFLIGITNLLLAPLTGPLIRSFRLQAVGAELEEMRGSAETTMLGTDGGAMGQSVREALLAEARPTCAESPGGMHDGALTPEQRQTLGFGRPVPKPVELSALHRAWRLVDQTYLKPIFGGRSERDRQPTSPMGNPRGATQDRGTGIGGQDRGTGNGQDRGTGISQDRGTGIGQDRGTDRHTDRYTDRHTDSNIDVAGPSLPTRPRVGTPLPVRIPTRLDTHMDSDEDGDQSDSDDGDKTRLRRR